MYNTKQILLVSLFFCLSFFARSQTGESPKKGIYDVTVQSAGIYIKDTGDVYLTKYPDGTIESRGILKEKRKFFCKKFYKDGQWKYYYPNGHLKREEEYKNEKHVSSSEFDEKGIRIEQ